MSHIHLPDGVLPAWLWIAGYVAAGLVWAVISRVAQGGKASRRLPLLGMMCAAMVLGASVEIVPIAYHVNLTVISGILLGPSFIFLASFVVCVLLALFGHGGITVIGLNTLVLSLEGMVGYVLFRLLWRVFRRLTVATFLATFLALLVSTLSMIGIVALGTTHYEELIHQGKEDGIVGFELQKKKEEAHRKEAAGETVNLRRFMMIVLPLGLVGWMLEAVITTLIVRYISRLRPDLLGLEGQGP